MRIKKIIKFLPVIIWMAVIFYFSSVPTTIITGSSFTRFFILKFFHLCEYAILAGLFYYAINKTLLSIYFSYLFSLTDEFHQYFVPGRNGKFTDTLIDLIGIILGLIVCRLFFSKTNRTV